MRRNTGGGVSPRSRAALKAANAGSSAWSNFCLYGDRIAQILPERGDHFPDSLSRSCAACWLPAQTAT